MNNVNRNIFYKKTFEHNNGGKYDDEWIKLGAMEFWDCGQLITTRKKNQLNEKLDDLIFNNWSLHICDSYVHTKCWTHRYIDNQTCWV